MDKKVFIIAGVVVVILAAGGAFVLSNKKDDTKPSSSNTQSTKTTDSSNSDTTKEDLGACAAADASVIKQALGTAAANLGAQQNTGVNGLGDGDKGQTCVYPFVEGATVTNSFYVDLASYASQATFNDASKYSSGGTSIAGIGDSASYAPGKTLAATSSKEFSLTVLKDKKIWKFVIGQPSAKVTFDDASAQTALVQIAKSAKL